MTRVAPAGDDRTAPSPGNGPEPSRDGRAAPSRSDPVVRSLSQSIGGPLGRHAGPSASRFWTVPRIVLALACLVLALGWVQKSPCRDGAWSEGNQYSRACYTDVLALYYAERLSEGFVPYRDHPVEYPVLTGAMMGGIGLPVHALGQDRGGTLNEGRLFYDLTALALAVCALGTAWAVLRLRRRRPWDAAMVALAPAVLVTATVNWDLFAVALSTLALLLWARRRPAAAGVLLGLAVAAKFYPLLFLGPLFLVCLRARRLPDWSVTAGAAAMTWFVPNALVYLAAPDSWLRFYRFSSERGVDWGTFWYVGARVPFGNGPLGVFTSLAEDVPRLNAVSSGLFLLACVGVAALALLAPRRPRLAALIFLTVAAFLLTNKVWSQQFVLWLVPLAVLARPRWGAFLAWQACELFYFLAFYQTLLRASGERSLMPEPIFLLASAARAGSLLVLCWLVVREALRPEEDVVRAGSDDDPDGGVVDGVPDRDDGTGPARRRAAGDRDAPDVADLHPV